MSIQPSVLIWTVICFCLFTLVFNGLILKPLLKVMDARRERAFNAKKNAEALEEAKRCALAERERQEEEKARLGAERIRAELDLLRAEKEAELGAFSESVRAQANNGKEPELLLARAESAVDARMGELVTAFENKLISGGKQ